MRYWMTTVPFRYRMTVLDDDIGRRGSLTGGIINCRGSPMALALRPSPSPFPAKRGVFSSPVLGAFFLPHRQTMFRFGTLTYGVSSSSSSSPVTSNTQEGRDPLTMVEYMGQGGGDDLTVLFTHLQYACKRIAALVASPFNAELSRLQANTSVMAGRDVPKPLDIASNEIILSSLKQ